MSPIPVIVRHTIRPGLTVERTYLFGDVEKADRFIAICNSAGWSTRLPGVLSIARLTPEQAIDDFKAALS